MGRYDKIRIWNGSSWYQPSQMLFRAPMKDVRYIYIYQNGSTANSGNHLCQVEAWTTSGVNVATSASMSCGPSGFAINYPERALKSSVDGEYAYITPENGTRTWFIVDLKQGYDLDYIKVCRYYPDGRTYYQTAICVVDTNGIETRLHEYTQQPLYAETSGGFIGKWIDLGTNDSSNTRPLHVWNGGWVRKTLNRQVNYGDKQWYCSNNGGYGSIWSGYSRYNLNQNKFHFYAYCCKDYDNDKRVAQFGSSAQGWYVLWQADGRIRWTTYYKSGATHSYSSNYIGAYNWAPISINFDSTGTGAGNMYFNGTWASANRSRRHQYSNQTTYIGNWGMMYRGEIRLHGINGGGTAYDDYFYINNFSVMSGAQTNWILELTSANTVSQDTSVSWV